MQRNLEHIRAYIQFQFYSNRIKKSQAFKTWKSTFWCLEKNQSKKNMKQNPTLVKLQSIFEK